MYSSFNLRSFGSYYNQNQSTQNQQLSRVQQSQNSSKFHNRIVEPFKNDSSPVTFASVVGFSFPVLPGKHNIQNMKAVSLKNPQTLKVKERINGSCKFNNPQKEFSDYSNMPILTSQSSRHIIENSNSFKNGPISSIDHHTNSQQSLNFNKMRGESIGNIISSNPCVLDPRNIVSTIQRVTSAYLKNSSQRNQQKWSNSNVQPRKSSNNLSNQKSQEKTMLKGYHEKVRASLEHNIQEDVCNLDTKTFRYNGKEAKNSNKTAVGVSEQIDDHDPPFLIYSLEEFPAIKNSMKKPLKSRKRKDRLRCEKRLSRRKSDDTFVIIASDAPMSTPPFEPPKIGLCEKIMNSPKKLIPSSSHFTIPLKPILKLTTPCRTISECSDDWIEFAYETTESLNNEHDDYETDTLSDESEDEDFNGACSSAEPSVCGEEICPNIQGKDDGLEKKKVSSIV